MSQHKSKGVSLRFAPGVKCVEAKCPDSCCAAGRKIDINPPAYQKLKQALPESVVKQNLSLETCAEPGAADKKYLNAADDGVCLFLDRDDALCSIQKEHGESFLGDGCREFPRRISVIDDTTERGLSLACPEAARLCLLDESATDVVEFDSGSLYERNFGLTYSQSASPVNSYY